MTATLCNMSTLLPREHVRQLSERITPITVGAYAKMCNDCILPTTHHFGSGPHTSLFLVPCFSCHMYAHHLGLHPFSAVQL